jgi:hypothetical protein
MNDRRGERLVGDCLSGSALAEKIRDYPRCSGNRKGLDGLAPTGGGRITGLAVKDTHAAHRKAEVTNLGYGMSDTDGSPSWRVHDIVILP